MSRRESRRPYPVPSEVVHETLRSAERLGRDVADVPIVVIAHALGVSRSTLLRQLGGSRRALDDAVREYGVDPGGRPPVRERAIAAAAATIDVGGLGSATMEAIAQRAQCSVPSLYAGFGGRDNLLEAVYERYIPPLDIGAIVTDSAGAPLVATVEDVYRLLAQASSRSPRVLNAVLTETLARPAGAGAGVLVARGALRFLKVLNAWLEAETAAGRVRELPILLLMQQLLSPVLAHAAMRPGLVDFPEVELPALGASCHTFAEAFVRGVATPAGLVGIAEAPTGSARLRTAGRI